MMLARLAIGLVLVVLGFWAFSVALGTVNAVKESFRGMDVDVAVKNDFPMFYAGFENVVSSERAHAYEKDFIVASILGQWRDPESETAQGLVPWLRYYNPPFYLFALSPLTLLDMEWAYLVLVLINTLCLVGLLVLIGGLVGWRLVPFLLISMATVGFMPIPAAIYNGQPTIAIAVLVLGAFLLQQRGRILLASVLLSLCAAKPHLAAAVSVPFLRHKPRAFMPLVFIGMAVTLVPFCLLGVDTLVDYFHLVLGRGEDDLGDTTYAARVLSWPGFMVALTGSSQPIAATTLSLLSLGLCGMVLLRGDPYLTWPACILAVLSVLPHSHPQDWILTVPAGVVLLLRPMQSNLRGITVGIIAISYLALNSWIFSSAIVVDGGRAFYAPAPMALLILAWLVAVPIFERGQVRQRARSLQPAPATA